MLLFSNMNDKVLGRALDELFELNVSKVYFELAIKVAKHFKLPEYFIM